jgi:glycosyltransferase involved in cell wall biosynthesis
LKTVLLGLPYFAKKIAENLSNVDPKNIYLAIDTGAGVWQKARYVWHIISAKVVYQVGGSHISGGALRLAMLLNRKIVMHWVGTDVLNLQMAYKEGRVDTNLIRRTKHLCEVDWIQKELIEVDLQSEIAQIACFENTITSPSKFPEKFSILTYVGSGREKFYGIDKLIALARIFPDIEIRIAGIAEYPESLPHNIRLLGWVENMKAEYQNCVLYLRLPEHDGLAFSVLEALACGRYVGYAADFTWTQKIADAAALTKFVESLLEKFNLNTLKVNSEGYKFVAEYYTRKKVMSFLAKIIAG